MTSPHGHQAWLAALLVAAPASPALTSPAQAEPLSFQEQRTLMRQMTQRLQARLEQRLRCIDKATKLADLQACQRSTGGAWRDDTEMGKPHWCCPMW